MTWDKPPAGRGVQYMSIFEITNQSKKEFVLNEAFANDTINKLLNYQMKCPLTGNKRANLDGYRNDHAFYAEETTITTDKLY